MSEPTCRLATPTDGQQITAIWSEGMAVHAGLDPRFPLVADAAQKFAAYLKEVLQDENAIVFVAEAESQVVGYCLARVSQHPAVFSKQTYGYINDLFVCSGHRREGVGKALFEATARSLRERGIRALEVSLVPSNRMASAFWRKMGFTQRLETLRLESDAT
jgi:ribosomal protein S18 acetylase RimI-like enzyme